MTKEKIIRAMAQDCAAELLYQELDAHGRLPKFHTITGDEHPCLGHYFRLTDALGELTEEDSHAFEAQFTSSLALLLGMVPR
jgi:hypothetical protein